MIRALLARAKATSVSLIPPTALWTILTLISSFLILAKIPFKASTIIPPVQVANGDNTLSQNQDHIGAKSSITWFTIFIAPARIFKNDGKRLPISEDMYLAYKIIMNDYKISYEADSIVYHSHNFTLKQIYQRYKLTGQFFKENNYLDQYGTTNSGSKLAKYVLKRIIQEHNFKMFFRYPFDMAARLFGMKAGKR